MRMFRFSTALMALFAFATLAVAQDVTKLEYPPLKPVKIPDVEEFTLSNGMRVFLLEDHELPLVRGVALIRTGNLFDPPDKVGLAGLTGEVLRSGGTREKTGDEIDEILESMAASIEAGIGETSGSISFSALKQNVDEVLPIFKELMANPAFRKERLDLALTQQKSAITRRNDSPGGIAQREFYETIYGKDNPYGWRQEIEHLENIDRQDLVEFHKRYFFPSNVILGIYGDFQSAALKKQLEQVFGDWTVKQPPVPSFPEVKAKPSPGIWIADKSDVNQTFLRIGHLGGTYKSPDYPALDVMADILGGGFASRLFKKVRTDLGYAYSVGSSWNANYNHPGTFSVSSSTRSEMTGATVKAILEEIERIRTGLVTEEELASAKQKVLNSFVFNFASPSQTLFRLLNDTYHGYPRDFLFQYQKAVENVTREDILRVAKEHLHPDRLAIVAVGNRQQFGQPLDVEGFQTHDVDLKIPMPGQEKAQPVSQDAVRQGKEALGKIRAAHGGDAILAVKDMRQEGTITVRGPNGPVELPQTVLWLAPHRYRQTQQTPGGQFTVYLGPDGGWARAQERTGPLPDQFRSQIDDARFRQTIRLLQADQDDSLQIALAEPGVLAISDNQGRTVHVLFDSATGQLTGKRYQSMTPNGTSQAVETFEDFQDVNGIRLPFRVRIDQDSRPNAELKISKIEINTGLTEDEISKKP